VQFDLTRIVIRQRGIWEVLDLALRVNRIYAKPLWLVTLTLALPLAILNAWVLHPVVADEFSLETNARYLWLVIWLVFLETPVATLPTTALLGRAMFLQDLSWRAIAGDIRQVLPGIVWTQGITRGGLAVVAVLLSSRPEMELGVGPTDTWLFILAAYSLGPRMIRPYVNEIVLLERNPLRRQDATTVTVGRRIRALHRANTGDLVARWIATALATTALTTSLVLTFWFAAGMMANDWRWGSLIVQWMFPCALWLATVYTAIVKFICYLDLRIRREGWEVELKVRAAAQELIEANRIQGQLT
jgi:hypothetical protein